jgi:peptidoglycan-N-acetylglucosamine deacetylase
MYLLKTPWWLSSLFPRLIWDKKNEPDSVFLTFDDGPIPAVTEFVLEILKSYHAKATFFCVGENLRRNPWLLKKILNDGHTVGNHTQHHLNGWKTNNLDYLNDINLCEQLLDQYIGSNRKKFFRPPYGRIRYSHIKMLKDYEIIMWSILSGDFDHNINPEYQLLKIQKHISAGSIIVFHDSLKARNNLKFLLPHILENITDKNLKLKSL